jgi:hypothetical protein
VKRIHDDKYIPTNGDHPAFPRTPTPLLLAERPRYKPPGVGPRIQGQDACTACPISDGCRLAVAVGEPAWCEIPDEMGAAMTCIALADA